MDRLLVYVVNLRLYGANAVNVRASFWPVGSECHTGLAVYGHPA